MNNGAAQIRPGILVERRLDEAESWPVAFFCPVLAGLTGTGVNDVTENRVLAAELTSDFSLLTLE